MTLKEAIEILSDAGISSAFHDAGELFRNFGEAKTDEIILRIAESDSKELVDAVHRRAKREPLQYIIGKVDFYRESYFLSPDCLIPRSDTEILVDYAVNNLPRGGVFLDLCTGSGCIAISTLKNTNNTTAVAVDISRSALKIAEQNAKFNDVLDRLTLLEQDVLKQKVEGKFDAIISNPPYVTNSAYEGLSPEIYFEPKLAFVGGEDGGDFYRAITSTYCESINEGGFIAYEIGYDQADLLKEIAEENKMSCVIIKDYSDNDRVAVLRKK